MSVQESKFVRKRRPGGDRTTIAISFATRHSSVSVQTKQCAPNRVIRTLTTPTLNNDALLNVPVVSMIHRHNMEKATTSLVIHSETVQSDRADTKHIVQISFRTFHKAP